jgi:phospholipid/cholesterol/gamma-HCH transport system substrate-binding protein
MRLPKGSTAEIVSDLLGNIKMELVLGPNAYDLVEPGDTITGGLQSGVMGMAAGMVPQIQKMLPKLDSILANVNMLLSDPALKNSLHNIDDITANLKKTSNELNTMTASLNNQMPSMLKNADGMLANANDLTRNLNELDLAATMAKVNQTLQNVEEMTAKLNSNEGTLGLLMRDPQLYNNLNSTMMHADSLVIDLKQHPKRYVHFSVFGKKDK